MKKFLKYFAIILGILGLTAVAWVAFVLWIFHDTEPYVPDSISSPDGSKRIVPSINFDKTDYDTYLLVQLDLQDTQTGESLFQVQTRASDRHEWKLEWLNERMFLLDSSDIGSYCWQEVSGNWEAVPCP